MCRLSTHKHQALEDLPVSCMPSMATRAGDSILKIRWSMNSSRILLDFLSASFNQCLLIPYKNPTQSTLGQTAIKQMKIHQAQEAQGNLRIIKSQRCPPPDNLSTFDRMFVRHTVPSWLSFVHYSRPRGEVLLPMQGNESSKSHCLPSPSTQATAQSSACWVPSLASLLASSLPTNPE